MKNKNLYKNKFRKETLRLRAWDYSWNGYYFITICTKNKSKLWFGEIRKNLMALNIVGCVVASEWEKTEKIRKNVRLDVFQIMPNHLHGIVIIENRDACNASLQDVNNKFGPQSNNLAAIIRGIKSATTKRIRGELKYKNFTWQSGYYEHIIRNETTLRKIREYILYNPLKWELDRNNPNSLA